MIDWILDKSFSLGDWVFKSRFRIHVFFGIFDILLFYLIYIGISQSIQAYKTIEMDGIALEIPTMPLLLLGGLFLPILHLALTKWGQKHVMHLWPYWMLGSVIIGISVGIYIISDIEAKAEGIGYQFCNTLDGATGKHRKIYVKSQDVCQTFRRGGFEAVSKIQLVN